MVYNGGLQVKSGKGQAIMRSIGGSSPQVIALQFRIFAFVVFFFGASVCVPATVLVCVQLAQQQSS